MSHGKMLPGDAEGDHAEEMHPQEQEEWERALEEEPVQDEKHHRDEVDLGDEVDHGDEVHPWEEEEVGVVVDSWEHRRPHCDDVSSLPDWHHLAGQL